MTRGSRFLAPIALAASVSACAVNLNEGRPARVLRGGEIQVSQVSSLVLPTRVIDGIVDPAARAGSATASGQPLPPSEEADFFKAAVLGAVQAPGYGTHLEFGLGLGYRIDIAARMGNGIYALSARRGIDLAEWDASVGARAAYNSGASWVPYADDIKLVFDAGNMTRLDSQLFASVGREWGEWARLWFGAKGMYSLYEVDINGVFAGTDDTTIDDHVWYVGGFFGTALGYRHVFLVAELALFYSFANVETGGRTIDMNTPIVVPSWGFRLVF